MENSENSLVKGYYHICSPGNEGRNFIKSTNDLFAAFNLIGVCAAESMDDVFILSFSIEDTHPHILAYGTKRSCEQLARNYERRYLRHVVSTRGDSDGVSVELEAIPVTDIDYQMSVGAYTIIQPTKDGKRVMPYDYRFGTGSMYFRSPYHIPIWFVSDIGEVCQPQRIGNLSKKQRNKLLFCKNETVPDNWLVCNGFLLPSNYIHVDLFEAIYKTHNCFRAFCSMSNKQIQELLARIAEYRGITLEDFEARNLCDRYCREMFGTADVRKLNSRQRLTLAQTLRRQHRISFRQLSTIVRLPVIEIKSYC